MLQGIPASSYTQPTWFSYLVPSRPRSVSILCFAILRREISLHSAEGELLTTPCSLMHRTSLCYTQPRERALVRYLAGRGNHDGGGMKWSLRFRVQPPLPPRAEIKRSPNFSHSPWDSRHPCYAQLFRAPSVLQHNNQLFRPI